MSVNVRMSSRLTVGAGLETKTNAEEIPQNESRMHSFSSKGEILEINQKTKLVKR